MAVESLPLERLPVFLVAGSYHAIGAELDPWPLLARLAELGARIALAATVADDAPLIFREAGFGVSMTTDALGVPAPPAGTTELFPDLLIVPVLAFDRAGGRLGQGAGMFDRTLTALRARGSIFALGLAYSGQEVASVPMAPHDQRLDAILTEVGYIEVCGNRGCE